jgi:hypothetical protein
MKGGIGSYIRGGGLEGTGAGTSEKKKWRGGMAHEWGGYLEAEARAA